VLQLREAVKQVEIADSVPRLKAIFDEHSAWLDAEFNRDGETDTITLRRVILEKRSALQKLAELVSAEDKAEING
jgi:hypothetical protein